MAVRPLAVLSLLATSTVLAAGATNAASLPWGPPRIVGYGGHSDFLPHGYTEGVRVADEGTPSPSGLQGPAPGGALPGGAFDPDAFARMFPEAVASHGPAFEPAINADAGGSNGTTGFGGGLPDGPAPSLKVETVPLPPALPLFGAALLLLSGIGYMLRRRAVPKP